MADKDELGRRGEELAADYLTANGYEILHRNWRCTAGEIDLVARTGDTVVVVEVKTRAGSRFGHPLEAITPRKLARLRTLTALWLRENARGDGAIRPARIRIDGVAVLAPPGLAPAIEHIEGIG